MVEGTGQYGLGLTRMKPARFANEPGWQWEVNRRPDSTRSVSGSLHDEAGIGFVAVLTVIETINFFFA